MARAPLRYRHLKCEYDVVIAYSMHLLVLGASDADNGAANKNDMLLGKDAETGHGHG